MPQKFYSTKSVKKNTVKLFGWEEYDVSILDGEKTDVLEVNTKLEYNCSIEAFNAFFTSQMKELIVKYTNECGLIKYPSNWKQLTVAELDAFFGTLILSGFLHDNHKSSHFLFSSECKEIYSLIFSRDRFDQLLSLIRFDRDASNRLKIEIERKKERKERKSKEN